MYACVLWVCPYILAVCWHSLGLYFWLPPSLLVSMCVLTCCKWEVVDTGYFCTYIIIIYPLTARVIGAPQMNLQPIFSIFPSSPLPSGTCRTQGLSIPWCCFPHLSLSCFLPHPFTVPCKMVLARPDERETWPYHCSLHFFSMVKRSSSGPIVFRILAQTFSLATWSFYEMRCVLR